MKDLEIIDKYKTPLYLYQISELKKRIEMIREYQKDIGLCYAMKASPLLAKYTAPYVDRLEVCSPGEYKICMRDHIDPAKILISGVNKTKQSLLRIIENGGYKGFFTIESREHFEIFDYLSKIYKKYRFKCYIRLTSGNQFGVDKETLEDLCDKVINSEYLDLVGIHYFSGTQKNLKKIESELTELSEYGKALQKKLGKKLSLEYGPGLSIDYFSSEKNNLDNRENVYRFNESDLKGLMEIVERAGIRDTYSDITFEYGRYIAATCGKYYTGVADVKTSDGTNYAILEGGLHQISYYGSMAGMKVPFIDYISKNKNEKSTDTQDYVLAGSLCSVNDILVRRATLPKLDIGDTLCFNLTGAYCATEGIALFLSRDLPAIVVINEDGSDKMLRDHIETNTFNGGYHG